MTRTEENKITLLLEFVADDESEREAIMNCLRDREQDAEDLQLLIGNIRYGINN